MNETKMELALFAINSQFLLRFLFLLRKSTRIRENHVNITNMVVPSASIMYTFSWKQWFGLEG
jgi:hypothetical protein